jgi:hypothetical protein
MKPQTLCYCCLLLLAVSLCAPLCVAQEIQIENVPDEIADSLALPGFAQNYSINGSMNPFYLRGDFDGDKMPDYAVWIKEKKSGSIGMAIWLSSRKKFSILGAGTPFYISGAQKNLDFLNFWRLFPKKSVEQGAGVGKPPKLLGDAILTGKAESASGIIYWTARKFVWYPQGD